MSLSSEPIITPSQAINTNEPLDRLPCGICRRQFSRYLCPRCNIPYCSLTCFRSESHSQCSEVFYKTQLESDINSSQSNSIEERLQMMNLLKRFEEENAESDPLQDDDGDESDEDDLQHRLAGMNLDEVTEEQLWSVLTPAERDKFTAAVRDPASSLAQTLLESQEIDNDVIRPWWETPSDVTSQGDIGRAYSRIDRKYGHSPQLMSVPPSMIPKSKGPVPAFPLAFNLTAILLVYSFITRHFAASPLSGLTGTPRDAEAARNTIGRLVPLLTEKRSVVKFDTLSAAITDVWSRFEAGIMTPALFALLLRDTAILLRPRRVSLLSHGENQSDIPSSDHSSEPCVSTLLALSDLHALFQASSPSTTSSKKTADGPSKTSNKSVREHVPHKLLFYAGQVLGTPPALLEMLVAEVEVRSKKMEEEGLMGVGDAFAKRPGSAADLSRKPTVERKVLVEEIA